MSHDHAHDHKSDAKAAFTGLIVGAIVLLVIMYGIVQLTNKKFEAHSAAAPAATAPH
jgi:hypothetical protein